MIWAGFLGLAIGNFATNPVYRLPRGESLFARDPYCGDCNAPLKPRDLFPVFSWLATRGKCRYCGAKIPGAYTVTEALCGLFFIALYLKFGFSEQFILCSFGTTALLMLAMMLYIDNFFSDRTLMACMILGMLHRTLLDGNIYGFLGTGYAGVIIGALAWKLSKKPMARDFVSFPIYLKLLAAAGIWLHWLQFTAVLAAAAFVSGARFQVSEKTETQNPKPETLKNWPIELIIIAGVIISVIFA